MHEVWDVGRPDFLISSSSIFSSIFFCSLLSFCFFSLPFPLLVFLGIKVNIYSFLCSIYFPVLLWGNHPDFLSHANECTGARDTPLFGKLLCSGGINRVRMQGKREATGFVKEKSLRFLAHCLPQFKWRKWGFFFFLVKDAFICHLFIPLRILASMGQTPTELKLINSKLSHIFSYFEIRRYHNIR